VELINEFSVGLPVEKAWPILTDLERIAPCLPGAQLQEVEGDEYRGIVKVKVGPITAQYKGKATFTERDDAAHRAVIRAEGRDTRGNGNASATITATLTEENAGTKVVVVTDLSVTGKVAQFGRGVMADVSSKLMDQFVQTLEADVLSAAEDAEVEAKSEAQFEAAGRAVAAGILEGEVPEAPSVSATPTTPEAPATPQTRRIDSAPVEPVDLLGTAGAPMLKRLLPVGGVLLLLWLLLRRRDRR
jgi:carbon monoxide dehydrogenase subunit G